MILLISANLTKQRASQKGKKGHKKVLSNMDEEGDSR